jgi:hypothetical protein
VDVQPSHAGLNAHGRNLGSYYIRNEKLAVGVSSAAFLSKEKIVLPFINSNFVVSYSSCEHVWFILDAVMWVTPLDSPVLSV